MGVSLTHRCVFVHIPKNAGTSIIKAFAMTTEGHLPWRAYEGGLCSDPAGRPYLRFCVVRHPLSRLVSCYEFARLDRSYYHAVDGPSRNGRHPDYDLLSTMRFEECMELLAAEPDRLRHPGWTPQAPWVCDDDGVAQVDVVCRYEHLAEDIGALCARLGATVELGRWNASGERAWRDHYRPGTLALAARLFAGDIERFGYGEANAEGQRRRLDALVAHRAV